MRTEEFLSHTSGLRALGGQRVWSLVISLFGDLAQEDGQSISGPVLSAIMQNLAIKPEAARVALHRLRKDGWLTSTKSGRISAHSLTAQGRLESAAASPRIYADPADMAKDWQIVLTPHASAETEETMAQSGFTAITSRVFVAQSDQETPDDALVLKADQVPDWLINQAEPTALQENYTSLLQALTHLQSALQDIAPLCPLQMAVLRCHIVHNWRRLVLKHPMLPAPLINPASPSHQCHLAVWDLLSRFPRPALAELEKQRNAA